VGETRPPIWYDTAVFLGVDPALTYRKKGTSLQMHYQRYQAYQSAWDQIQCITNMHKWPYPHFLKTELINLFRHHGRWNSHMVKNMQVVRLNQEMRMSGV
jgi:hypothetical protein